MGFRPKKEFPRFADLKGILAQSKVPDDALYQTVQELIERLSQLREVTQEKVDAAAGSGVSPANFATRFATYHTKNDEQAALPNSVQLLAGFGIVFDDTDIHKRVISTLGSSHYDAPLSDGDLDEANLIFASGECIIVQVPV